MKSVKQYQKRKFRAKLKESKSRALGDSIR